MKSAKVILLALTTAAVATAAQAEPIMFELGDVVARLHQTPCDNVKVQAVLLAPGQFRAADITWQGQPLAACWAVVGNQVIVIDETGDSGYLMPEGFSSGQAPV